MGQSKAVRSASRGAKQLAGVVGLSLVATGFSSLTQAQDEANAAVDTVPVDVGEGTSADLQRETSQPAVQLETVVVTGTRTEHTLSDSPVEVQLIDQRTIRNSGARDLAELLEREGGVYVSRSTGRGSSIEIQGLSGQQVLILLDGRRQIGRVFGSIDLTRLRLDSVERVEIVKGPTSALYGADALGGVVNVITRKGGAEQGGSLTVRGDENDNLDVLGNAGITLAESLKGQVSGGYLRTQPYDLDDSTPAEQGIDGRTRFGSGDVNWQINDAASVDFYGAYSLEDTSRIDAGVNALQAYDTRKRIEEVRAGIAPRFVIGPETLLRFDGYFNRYYDQFLQQQRGNLDNVLYEATRNNLYAGNGQLDHRIGAHQLSVGGEYQFEELDSDRLEQRGERDRESVFVQDEWTLGNLVLVPGLRYDRDSQYGDQVSPKFALRYDIMADLFLRAGYGRGYRAPDFKELLLRFSNPSVGYVVEGNPDLKPEKSQGYNAGITWLPTRTASVALSLYHNDVDNLIQIVEGARDEDDPQTQVFTYDNVAKAKLSGLDLQTRWQPWQLLNLQLGYGYLRSRDEDTGDRLSGRPTHKANATIRYQPSVYALQLRGVWIGDRLFTVDLDSGGAPTPAGKAGSYALLDARAEWNAWRGLTLSLGVDNLLDEGDEHYLPIAPRAAYLEARWSWK